jgi:hypothetical protein
VRVVEVGVSATSPPTRGDPVGVETGTTGELVRHRQTKGAATDMVDLKPPAPHFRLYHFRKLKPVSPGLLGSRIRLLAE